MAGGDRVKEVIVVEGRDDAAAVKRALDARIIETRGYAISGETWALLEAADREKGLLILTDPDFSGKEIRKKLTARFPKAKQAYLTVSQASRGGEVGVEHAAPQAIREAVLKARATKEESARETFSVEDARRAGLAGGPGSAEKRAFVGKLLGIGYGNAKSFRNKLNRCGVTPEELNEAILARGGRGHEG